MKDLDFDELDQAVNSLMTGIPKTPAPQDDKAAEKTLTIMPTLSENERPSFATLEQTASQAGTEIEKAEVSTTAPSLMNPLAARRSSGRFMDVVHPSSDMKINNRPVTSREGIQLNPIAPRPVVVEPQPSREPEVFAAAADQTPEVVEQPLESNPWPDPIDMMTPTPVLDAVEHATAVEEASVPEVSVPSVAVNAEEPAPLQTPFLTDTKVEKRPLGAFAVEQQVVTENMPEAEVASDDIVAETQPPVDLLSSDATPNQEVAAELPDELQHDLIKIESDSEVTQSEPVAEKTVSAPSFTEPVVTPVPTVATGPASIQPQYKEEPSSTKEEHAGIYDTDSYHKPLAHPAKKKSGWLWVLWIVLLLALGAGGAAALYYFKII